MTRQFVRPDLIDLEPVVHGSVTAVELAQLGLTPAGVLDFSVNTNPLGPAPTVLSAVRETDWSRYPGDDEGPLRQALARRSGVAADQVALGNGSAELLWLIALAVLRPGDPVVIIGPTFGEYVRAARAIGACPREVEGLSDLPPARLVFLCNPNNPTGRYCHQAVIERILLDDPERLLVLDEAYVTFVSDAWRSELLLETFPNLVILRSLTKDHAVPGLRLGYLLAGADLARGVEAVRPPWSVNAGALRCGLATLQPAAAAHVARGRALVTESRRVLTEGFADLGYKVGASAANFVLVQVGDGAAFRRALLPHGMVVRDCASFGLPAFVRVACRVPAECTRLLEVARRIRP